MKLWDRKEDRLLRYDPLPSLGSVMRCTPTAEGVFAVQEQIKEFEPDPALHEHERPAYHGTLRRRCRAAHP